MSTHELHPPFDRRTLLRAAFFAGAGSLGLTSCAGGAGGNTDTAFNGFSMTPSWEQDFSDMPDGPIDASVWNFNNDPNVPGYNNELQGYSPDNVYIKDGILTIEARPEPFVYADDPEQRTFEYTSGRIETANSLTFAYGKLEARMKMPAGPGVWPAFWLQSATTPYTPDDATDADWNQPGFYERNGEIDVEYYGHTPGQIEATVLTNHAVLRHGAAGDNGMVAVPDAETSFHTYGIALSPDRIAWTLDGQEYRHVSKTSDDPMEWPFTPDNRFKAILNLAMGGNIGGPIDDSKQPWTFKIEKVSFFDHIGVR